MTGILHIPGSVELKVNSNDHLWQIAALIEALGNDWYREYL